MQCLAVSDSVNLLDSMEGVLVFPLKRDAVLVYTLVSAAEHGTTPLIAHSCPFETVGSAPFMYADVRSVLMPLLQAPSIRSQTAT